MEVNFKDDRYVRLNWESNPGSLPLESNMLTCTLICQVINSILRNDINTVLQQIK